MTPLVTMLYLPHLRRRITASGANFDDVADDKAVARKRLSPSQDGASKTRFTVVLDKLEHLPGMMALPQLIQPPPPSITKGRHHPLRRIGLLPRKATFFIFPRFIITEALRLIELSDRVSAAMKSSIRDSLLTDSLLSIFQMFGQLNGISVSPTLSIVKFEDLAYSVAQPARNFDLDMIMIPWLPPVHDAFDDPAPEHHHPPNTPLPQPMVPPMALTTSGNTRSPHTHNLSDILFKSANF